MTLWLDLDGRAYRVELTEALLARARGRAEPDAKAALASEARCTVDGVELPIDVRMVDAGVLSLVWSSNDKSATGKSPNDAPAEGGVRRQLRCVLDGDSVLVSGRRYAFVESDPRSLQARAGAAAGAGGAKAVKAPMPGRVVRLLAAVGDEVAEGQGLLVIEAMKMQNELRSPKAGRVAKLTVSVGDTVASGLVLAVVE